MRIGITTVALAIGALPAIAQEPPKPAPVLQIFRESIKEGRGAAHEKVEGEYAAAFRKANFPGHYVALSAMSGTGEVWFVQPAPSFGATEDWMKAEEKEPLKSAVAMLDARDGELRSGSRSMYAVFHSELSYNLAKFNPYKARFFSVGTYRLKLGQEQAFTKAAQTLFAAYEKANIDECIVGYQVVAGAPSGTYLFIVGMDSLKFMDDAPARSKSLMEAMGEDQFSQFMKGTGDLIASIESTLFQVKPGMSYVGQAAIDADPAFWKPKPAPKPAAAPSAAPTEKKGAN
jgi:hypothetical protein